MSDRRKFAAVSTRSLCVCVDLLSGLSVRLSQVTHLANRRHQLRRRLQPRAVARGDPGRGHRADARGRRQPRLARDLLLGPARAAPGRVRLRLAGPVDGPAARRRHPGRPGHRHRLATALAGPAPPRGAAGRPGRQPALARQPADLLPLLAGLRRALAAAGRAAGEPLRRPPGPGDVARLQRARLPQRALLLRRQRGRVPRLAAAPVRRGRPVWTPSTTPGARRSGASTTPTGATSCRRDHHGTGQPDPGARLLAVLLRRAARHLPARARRAAGGHPGRAGDDELHDADPHPRHGLLVLGAGDGRRLHRPLPRRRARPARRRAGLVGRPDPRPGRAASRARRGC